MIRILLKDLREMWAAPGALIAVIAWACLVLAIAAVLPLPNPRLDIAVADTPVQDQEFVSCGREEFEPDEPFPSAQTLKQALLDIPGTALNDVDVPGTDIFASMDQHSLDIVFAWHPTCVSLGEIVDQASSDWGDFAQTERRGVWMAYSRPRSRGDASQVRFVVRQAQASALAIDNANLRGEPPYLPSAGLADVISEFAVVAIAADGEDDYGVDPAVSEAMGRLEAGHEAQFGRALTPQEGEMLYNALYDAAYAPHENLRERFLQALTVLQQNQDVPAPLQPDSIPEQTAPAPAESSAGFTEEQREYFSAAFEFDEAGEKTFVAGPFFVVERDGPARATSAWLVPGLILIISAAVAFMFTAHSVVREREQATEHLLLAGLSRGWPVAVFSKALAPLLFSVIVVAAVMVFSQLALGFDIKQGAPLAILAILICILLSAVQGLIVGTLVPSQTAAMAVSGAYIISLLLFSGIFIPLEQSAPAVLAVASFLPVTWVQQSWFNWMTWGSPVPLATLILPLVQLAVATLIVFISIEARRRSN